MTFTGRNSLCGKEKYTVRKDNFWMEKHENIQVTVLSIILINGSKIGSSHLLRHFLSVFDTSQCKERIHFLVNH